MGTAPADRRRPRNIGDFVRSGDWSGYWSTRISEAREGSILIHGYPLEEVVENLSYVEAMWLLLRGEPPTPQQAAIWDVLLRSAMDQQFISSAVCAARFVASAHPESPIPALAAGILAHGSVTGSPRPAAEMIYAADEMRRREGLSMQETARRVVEEYQSQGRLLPGFGHPLHKTTEPRAEVLRRLVKGLGGWGEKAQLFEAIHEELGRRTGKSMPINLAGMVAAVYCELGFEPLLVEALAAAGYATAVAAHVAEEIREGVPLRIIPEALGARYTGPPLRHLPKRGRKR